MKLGELALVVATLGLVAATILLWWEARKLRTEANVVVWAAPWELAGGLYIAILLQNAGPVIAREVRLTWRLARTVDGRNGVLSEPIIEVGFRRTIPMKWATLDQLAAEAATIEADLTWRDGRRGRQSQTLRISAQQIKDDYDESGALPRPSQLEVLGQIRDQIKELVEK
ncbi:MAG TPA: hypothetical protein VJW75_00650 [Candidatus Eisenbacteria bacterium]|nr:hypothetical protein [Candidatus Eisenbacteria bacterium]